MSVTMRRSDLVLVARRLAAEPRRWPIRPVFDPTSRWYARLATRDDYEAWLLTWLPGQATDLHDHGGSAGVFLVLEGALTEQVPAGDRVAELWSRRYAARATRSFSAHHIHRIVNEGSVPAVSLHVYAPALARMTRYAVADGALRAVATDRAGSDW